MSAVAETRFNAAARHWGVVTHSPPSFTKVGEPLVALAPGVGEVARYLGRLAEYLWNPERDEVPTLHDERSTAPSWLGDLYTLVQDGETDRAVDVLFDRIDDLLIAEDFGRCNDLLLVVDPKRLDTHLLVSVLSVTKSAAERLPNRPTLVRRVEERLSRVAPDRIERLLNGLR